MQDSLPVPLDGHVFHAAAEAGVGYAMDVSTSESSSISTDSSSASSSSDLEIVHKLKFFLATAPSHFPADVGPACSSEPSTSGAVDVVSEQRRFQRFTLPNGEHVSCVFWNGLYHITGTDIIRTLVFRFRAFGRRISNMKKFEEGVFSDLRNLKAGVDATLEVPKSPFLDLLFRNSCIRTQKKQKVFYWYSVPHDKLFLDALERDSRREKTGQDPSSVAVAEPALSFRYNPSLPLLEQLKENSILHEQSLYSLPPQEHLRSPGAQLQVKIEGLDQSAGQTDHQPSRSSYSPRNYILESGPRLSPHLASPMSGIHPTGNRQLTQPNELINGLILHAEHTHPFIHMLAKSEPPFQPFAPSSIATAPAHELEHQQNGVQQVQFVCPWYTCGQLFMTMNQLVEHIPGHSMAVSDHSSFSMYDIAGNQVSMPHHATPLHSSEETAVLLQVLRSSAIDSHCNPPKCTTAGCGCPESQSQNPPNGQVQQDPTDEYALRAFTIAPTPSIRKRSEG